MVTQSFIVVLGVVIIVSEVLSGYFPMPQNRIQNKTRPENAIDSIDFFHSFQVEV